MTEEQAEIELALKLAEVFMRIADSITTEAEDRIYYRDVAAQWAEWAREQMEARGSSGD